MAYCENIVIGHPLVEPKELLSLNDEDWDNIEKEKTIFTEERSLPKILVENGIYKSISEIRRNKPELMITFDDTTDFIDKLKVAKKKFVWIIVGRVEEPNNEDNLY